MARHSPEDDLLRQILELAKLTGWRTLHIRPARTVKGWRTPLQGDGVGWPDLVLVRGGDLLFVELKSDTGRPTPEQQAWLDALCGAKQRVCIWRPSDWDAIKAFMTAPRR